MKTNIDERVVKKIHIKVEVDVPVPYPMMIVEEVGKGRDGTKDITVDRNMSGNLLLVHIGKNGYVVNVQEIVKGLLAYENERDPSDMWPEKTEQTDNGLSSRNFKLEKLPDFLKPGGTIPFVRREDGDWVSLEWLEAQLAEARNA